MSFKMCGGGGEEMGGGREMCGGEGWGKKLLLVGNILHCTKKA